LATGIWRSPHLLYAMTDARGMLRLGASCAATGRESRTIPNMPDPVPRLRGRFWQSGHQGERQMLAIGRAALRNASQTADTGYEPSPGLARICCRIAFKIVETINRESSTRCSARWARNANQARSLASGLLTLETRRTLEGGMPTCAPIPKSQSRCGE